MNEIPIKEILIHFAPDLPIGDEALFNIIERLEDTATMPPDIALQANRHALRVVRAILPDFDILPPKMLAVACGQRHLEDYPFLSMAINCQNNWIGETTPAYLRNIIYDIKDGKKPKDVLDFYKVNNDERLFLEELLGLEQYHKDILIDRVMLIQQTFRGIRRIYHISKSINSINPRIIYKYYKITKEVLKDLNMFYK